MPTHGCKRMVTDLLTRAFGPWVRQVDKLTLRADLIAGVLGALLVLPQGFAFATLAGLPPEYGLYTAIVPCIVAAFVRVELARGLGADQRQLAGAVRDPRAAGGGRLAGLHPARAGGHGAGRPDAVADRRAAPRRHRQLHLALGVARLHDRCRGADRGPLADRPDGPAGRRTPRHRRAAGAHRPPPGRRAAGGAGGRRGDAGGGAGPQAHAAEMAVHAARPGGGHGARGIAQRRAFLAAGWGGRGGRQGAADRPALPLAGGRTRQSAGAALDRVRAHHRRARPVDLDRQGGGGALRPGDRPRTANSAARASPTSSAAFSRPMSRAAR